jgi:hypothetical protein
MSLFNNGKFVSASFCFYMLKIKKLFMSLLLRINGASTY